MNRDVLEARGAVLVVSQFTLLADCRAGRRPSFTEAAEPALAERLYGRFNDRVAAAGLEVATGVFRAHMNVALVNDGPVTFLLDSRKQF
jgi:D-tyrosyl-tRNA(Tyr) deacylase